MNVCVLLPAYNEEKTIALLVKDIKVHDFDVIVVDDGSTDNTGRTARDCGALVLSHPRNLGKGRALRTGFKYIRGGDYDAVVVMDSDGQHSPDEIHKFIEHGKHSHAGIILGNRMHAPQGMPFIRRLTNKVTSFLISKAVKTKIPDSQCGFRLIRTEVLKKLNLSTINYDTETEIILEVAKNRFVIESIPIKTIYADQKSQINPIVDTIRFWKLISKYTGRKK